jgi:hypothetical protein
MAPKYSKVCQNLAPVACYKRLFPQQSAAIADFGHEVSEMPSAQITQQSV